MKALRHICLILAVMVMAFSCGNRGKVIPKHKLAAIYARMLVADQRVRNDSKLASVADTTLFYAPILAEFGYTEKDYVRSVGHYMEDPETFGNIFKEAKSILDERIQELTADERAARRADSIRNAIAGKVFLRAPLFMDMWKDSVRHDTVHVSIDTGGLYVWERILPDTLYRGPAFSLRHELDSAAAVVDSVAAVEPAAESVSTAIRRLADKELPVHKKNRFPGKDFPRKLSPLSRIAE